MICRRRLSHLKTPRYLGITRSMSTASETPLPSEATTPVSRASTPKHTLPVNFEDIARAVNRIRSGIIETELTHSYWLSEICGCEIYLKHELKQFTGSFKERGARNSLALLSDAQKKSGVVAASAGNHALALSYHGKKLGIPVSVIMPTVAPIQKVGKCRAFGANVVIHGENIGEAKSLAEEDPRFKGMLYINGYDDKEIVAGAGTMGLEIANQMPDADYIIIPTGGAGLLAGTSLALKTLTPEMVVVAVEPTNCMSFAAALKAGKPVHFPTLSTIADGLAVPQVGSNAFLVAREYTDEVCNVNENLIALAVLRLVETEKMVVEGGGAIGLAAILPGGPMHKQVQGKKVIVPVCGGNIDTTTLGRIIDRGLAADERLVRFICQVDDKAGGVHGLSKILLDQGASIKDIYHERAWLKSSVSKVQVKCIIETGGPEHALKIKRELAKRYPIAWQPEIIFEDPPRK